MKCSGGRTPPPLLSSILLLKVHEIMFLSKYRRNVLVVNCDEQHRNGFKMVAVLLSVKARGGSWRPCCVKLLQFIITLFLRRWLIYVMWKIDTS